MINTDILEISIDIAATPAEAFRLFTEETEAWWQYGGKYRPMPQGVMIFEPGVGGRLLQKSDTEEYVFGQILTWVPGNTLEFEWKLHDFLEGQMTRVRISFEPINTGTRLTVVHSGWDTLPPDHPARHGRTGEAFVKFRTGWWVDLLEEFRRRY